MCKEMGNKRITYLEILYFLYVASSQVYKNQIVDVDKKTYSLPLIRTSRCAGVSARSSPSELAPNTTIVPR